MIENIPEWITNLALNIYKVIQKYNAMPRFSEMVNTWTKSHEAESRKLNTWKKKRKSYFEQTVARDPNLQDKNKQPEQDWQFEGYCQHLGKKTESGNQYSSRIIYGWVPPELSNSAKPEITQQLLPLRRGRALAIIEKYAILAAVYECGQKGAEKLSLLESQNDWREPNALSNTIRSISFVSLCDAASKLDQGDEGWLKAILDDIEKDVSKEERSAETGQGNKDTKREQEGMIEVRKPWYKKTWIIIVGIVTVLTGLSALVYICESETGKHFINSFKRKPSISADYRRTELYARTKKRVDDFYESIRNEKLDPWLFINAGVKVQVAKHNGDVKNFNGVLFTGAPRNFFWSDDFIPPFIEDAIMKVFDQTIDECRKNGLDPEIYVYEAKRILSDFIYKIYNRMADMDQKLMKRAHSENFGRRDVSREIEKMCKRLDEHYNAAILLASGNKNTTTTE